VVIDTVGDTVDQFGLPFDNSFDPKRRYFIDGLPPRSFRNDSGGIE